jgi:hypothetical protein
MFSVKDSAEGSSYLAFRQNIIIKITWTIFLVASKVLFTPRQKNLEHESKWFQFRIWCPLSEKRMSERVFQRKKNSEKHMSEKTSQRKYKTAKNKTTLTLTLTLTFISSPCFADLYFAQMFFAYFFFRCFLFAVKASLKRLSLNCNHTQFRCQ